MLGFGKHALHEAVGQEGRVRLSQLSACDVDDGLAGLFIPFGHDEQLLEEGLVYLSEDGASGERHDAYIKNSLAEEKANLLFIAEEIKKRGGDPLPIEKRMRRSMERMASAAGIDLESVPAKKEVGWPNSVERLKALSPTAYPAYRAGSTALHAGWSVLLAQDIDNVAGGFSLDKQFGPRVQPMTAAGQLIAETTVHYLEREGDEAEKAWFLDRVIGLAQKIREVDEAHEQFIQSA